ncbi:hypothetical protein I4U23_000061 [Adineta vaga]|nr:hypothetical protein I4U23_000061 [Adineta vaga]
MDLHRKRLTVSEDSILVWESIGTAWETDDRIRSWIPAPGNHRKFMDPANLDRYLRSSWILGSLRIHLGPLFPP